MIVSDPTDAAFRRHREQVFRYLRRRTNSDEAADDLTQEVFLTAAAHLATLDASRPLLAWLYRVAQSRLIDEARRVRRRPRAASLDLVPENAELDFGNEVAAALRRAARRLRPHERELIAERLFGGQSFAELAGRAGATEAAVKMRYVRALRALRAELEKEGIEP